jgi:hypothetical protein
MVFLNHLHIWVFGKAVLADGRKVGGLPSRAIQIMFNLGRHDGSNKVEVREVV